MNDRTIALYTLAVAVLTLFRPLLMSTGRWLFRKGKGVRREIRRVRREQILSDNAAMERWARQGFKDIELALRSYVSGKKRRNRDVGIRTEVTERDTVVYLQLAGEDVIACALLRGWPQRNVDMERPHLHVNVLPPEPHHRNDWYRISLPEAGRLVAIWETFEPPIHWRVPKSSPDVAKAIVRHYERMLEGDLLDRIKQHQRYHRQTPHMKHTSPPPYRYKRPWASVDWDQRRSRV